MFFKKKKIGLALGGGAARGWGHIGILKVFNEEKIPISFITGTSAGALVGAVYISNKLKEFENFLLDLDWKKIFNYTKGGLSKKGLIDGSKLFKDLEKYITIKNFNDTPIPFCAIATDLFSGNEIRLNQGNIINSVRASISIPGIFKPVKLNGKYLIDGGAVNPIPVNVVKEMGADIIIGVDLNHYALKVDLYKRRLSYIIKKYLINLNEEDTDSQNNNLNYFDKLLENFKNNMKHKFLEHDKKKPVEPNIFDIIGLSIAITEKKITELNLINHQPDFLIRPQLGEVNPFDFPNVENTIKIGYNEMKKIIPQIKKIIHAT